MHKAHKIFGFIIFSISAIFFVSLAISALDFGLQAKNQNFLFLFGKSLAGTYGISSICIPVFLAFAALQFFEEAWETKRGIMLLLSIIPFYTLVAAEKIIKNFAYSGQADAHSAMPFIMVTVSVASAALLIAIEFIAIGIFGDSVTNSAMDSVTDSAADSAPSGGGSVESAAPISQPNSVPEEKNEASSDKINEATVKTNGMYTLVKAVKTPRSYNPVKTAPSEVLGIELPEVKKIEKVSMEKGLSEKKEIQKPINKYHITFGENDDKPIVPLVLDAARGAQNAQSAKGEGDGTERSFSVFDAEDVADAVEPFLEEMPEEVIEDEIEETEVFETPPPRNVGIENETENEIIETIKSPKIPAVKEAPQVPNPVFTFRGGYTLPPPSLLTEYPDGEYWVIDEATKKSAAMLRETLREFNIEAEVTGISKGPVITMFEILPAPGVKLSKIAALQDNIALRLAASSVRIVAPIPGKHAVGIEVPNKKRSIVSFREIISAENEAFSKMAVPVVLGKNITGVAQIIDLAKTPHMLIAGATGAGKSVCVNSLILSILYTRYPREVKMILIDPKIVELKLYNDIPHLLTPVITEPKKAFQALQYALCEMERRYALLDGMGVRDITNYNLRITERNIAAEKLPYIVIIIDEFADLMATTGKELETTVARLAAMSRAVGIHLVLATQRPSIDVITGLIKANIPTRIAFMVASKMDSRIIIDQVGAEKLLGRGDMLYSSAADPFPMRIQGTFVSDSEVENVADYVKSLGEPDYIDDEIFIDEDDGSEDLSVFSGGTDPLYDKALEIIVQSGKASASYIQRRLKIGYNRAARLIEEMEERGIVGPAQGSKPREIIHLP